MVLAHLFSNLGKKQRPNKMWAMGNVEQCNCFAPSDATYPVGRPRFILFSPFSIIIFRRMQIADWSFRSVDVTLYRYDIMFSMGFLLVNYTLWSKNYLLDWTLLQMHVHELIYVISYNHIGLSTLRLIGHQFGEMIRMNVASPPPQGCIDFAREERYHISSCFSHSFFWA